MDPFSITVGTLGITEFAVSSIDHLRDFINNLAEAKGVVQDVSSSLAAIKRPLAALEELKISDDAIYALAKESLEKTGVAQAVNTCGTACDAFTKKLEGWTKHSSNAKLSFRDRLSVALNKERIRTLRMHVQSCQSIVQFAVQSTQLLVQVRSQYTYEIDREETKKQLKTLERAIQEHMDLTVEKQDEAQKRQKELQEESEDEMDGGAQQNAIIKEVEEQSRFLEADYICTSDLLSEVQNELAGQKIRDVKATKDSIAVAGFINTSGEKLKMHQDISGVTSSNRSFAGAGVINNLDFKDLRLLSATSQTNQSA